MDSRRIETIHIPASGVAADSIKSRSFKGQARAAIDGGAIAVVFQRIGFAGEEEWT